jgi:hypothetical protein
LPILCEAAEQFLVAKDEPAQERAIHDGQEVGASHAVQQVPSAVAPQGRE